MNPAQKPPEYWAKKVAGAIVGWRYSESALCNSLSEFMKWKPDLAPADFAEKVYYAAKRKVRFRLFLGGVIGLVLLTMMVLVIIRIVPEVLEQISVSVTPVVTVSPTAKLAPRVLQGHIYRGRTSEGLENVEVSLDVYDGTTWMESVVTTTTDVSGSFSLEIPARWRTAQKCQIHVNPPSPWNSIKLRQGNGWNWSNTTPDIFTTTLQGTLGPLEIEVAIQRIFTGILYLQGEGAPSSVVITLNALGDTQEVTLSVMGPAGIITYPHTVPFTLTHIGVYKDTLYQIQITDPAGKDWAVSGPSDVSEVDGSSLLLTPGTKVTVTDIVLAGPFPITLTYEMAKFDPPLRQGPWQITGTDTITYAVVTRQEPDQPQDARVYWPVYLPGGNEYEIWVGTPGAVGSAVLSYTLYSDDNGKPGQELTSTIPITEVTQCGNQDTNWQMAARYQLGEQEGGRFWVVVDEGRARPPESGNCAGTFQMAIWKIAIRRQSR